MSIDSYSFSLSLKSQENNTECGQGMFSRLVRYFWKDMKLMSASFSMLSYLKGQTL
jgi:hypothetical protein